MAKLVLDVFGSMTSGHTLGRRNDRVDTYHRYIEGFVPHYEKLASENVDTNLRSKVNPPLSLIATPNTTVLRAKSATYPAILLPNENASLQSVIYSTDLWHFYSDDGTTETDLGIPTGTPTSNAGIDAVILNGQILTSHPGSTALYHGAISATPGWAATTGNAVATTTRVLKNFQNKVLVTDASSGAFTRNDKVQIVDSSFAISDGITLGDTFHIQDIGVYLDRYALLYTRKSLLPRLARSTTVFLWDVVPGDGYDRKMSLKGVYVCSIEREGIPYAFTQLGTTLICWAFDGAAFREMGRLRNTVVSANTNIPKMRVALEGDYFVLTALSPGNSAATSILYWNPATGESFYPVGPANGTDALKVVMIAQDSSDYTYKRYFSFQSGDGFGWLMGYQFETGPWWGTKKYKSNFIPAPVLEGQLFGRMQINNIELEYNAKPPVAADSIALTLTTKDEYETETYTQQSATVKTTTATSTNARVDNKRAILTLGAIATEFAIDLTVTVANTDNTWQPIIRRIIIDYDPIALQP